MILGGGLEKNESEQGAYRERSEESKFIFGKLEQKRKDLVSLKSHEIQSLLISSKNFIQIHHWNVLKTGTYRIIIKINYIDPAIFNKAQVAGKHVLNEKSDYKWFSVKKLMNILPFELRKIGLADAILKPEVKSKRDQVLKKIIHSLENFSIELVRLNSMISYI